MLSEPYQQKIHTETFAGRTHKLKIAANDFYETENLSTDEYPMLSSRPLRGTVARLTNPTGLISKDELLYCADGKVYFGGTEIIGLTLSGDAPTQIVSMGAYAVFFPDKKYLNTADLEDFGSLEASWSAADDTPVSYSICTITGESYGAPPMQGSEPSDPVSGQLWIDTSGDTHSLKQWSEASGMWVTIPTVYTKISAPNIGAAFSDYDGVTLSGIAYTDDTAYLASQIDALNGTKVIYKRDTDYIIVVGLLDQSYTQAGGVNVSRDVPDMDYVCEAGNRLWGCKYGVVDGKPLNEIYGCKLGDFKNWNCFLGISTDSWVGSVGSDGVWTAAVNYLGYPTFFKESRIHQVLISSTGAHQLQETVCSGVEKGSWRSPCVAGQILYYKGLSGVYAYDGSQPVLVSDALGGVQYRNARAGSVRGKYYISMQDADAAWHLFAYDTSRGMWMREDGTQVAAFAAQDDDLFFIDETTGEIKTVYGTQGTLESGVSWSAESGVQGYEFAEKKYVGRYNFRIKVDEGTSLTLWIEYDSSGEWINKGTIEGNRLATYTLPVIPRRCDHLRYKITGTGAFKLFSITRILEVGSDM